MNTTIRLETETDHAFVDNLTREAFWDVYHPGADEHLVLHKIRTSPCFIPELDFVAEQNGEIVGHVICTKAKVIDNTGMEHEVLCLGPISVSPSLQKQGIGSLLIKHTQATARNFGYKAIVLFGNPAYYHRYGIKNAAQYHITTREGENFDPFMIFELHEGSLSRISGKFYEDPVFNVTPEEVEEFEKGFPYKEKHVTDSQLKSN